MTDLVDASRLSGSRSASGPRSAISQRVADLASTFPLLFSMLTWKCGPLTRRQEAIRLAELGNSLADVAETYGLPLCLRRIPTEACRSPPPWVAWSAPVGQLLADHIPKSPSEAASWLAATFYAAKTCNEDFGLWIARQRSLVIGGRLDIALLEPLALYAWHSCNAASPLHRLAIKSWSPDLGIKTAITEAEHWLTRLKLLIYCGGHPIPDCWLDAGRVAGFDFLPLTTWDAIAGERVAMRNCLHTYVDKLARGACRLFAVKTGNRSVATLEIASNKHGDLSITQLKGPANAKPSAELVAAASAWLKGQQHRRAPLARTTSPGAARTALHHLFEAYRQATGMPASSHGAATTFQMLREQLDLFKGRLAAPVTTPRRAHAPLPPFLPPARPGALGIGVRRALRVRLGDDIYTSWFQHLEFHAFDTGVVQASVPVRFLKNWIEAHYAQDLLACCAVEFEGVERVEIGLHQPGVDLRRAPYPAPRVRSSVNGIDGSPLDPRFSFDSFVVGPANRLAYAAAVQIAQNHAAHEPTFNPLYLHSRAGLGKTHLLHAIAWEVTRHRPNARVLYVTAERFRYQFAGSIANQTRPSSQDSIRADIFMVDDLEFLRGECVEREFEEILKALLDASTQLVLASARQPAELDLLTDNVRSRLQRGLVAEIQPMDVSLRLQLLEKRALEKRAAEPDFRLSQEVLGLLAGRLTGSGRELEGVVNRLLLTWQLMRSPVTLDIAETICRDIAQDTGPRRVLIESILRVVSRHFAVSRQDIVSPRRHRSVVRPRQIGMYLAKHLTSRSLSEIGRRFGDRDHTTVQHAVRKIESELRDNPRLRIEIEELKRQLST